MINRHKTVRALLAAASGALLWSIAPVAMAEKIPPLPEIAPEIAAGNPDLVKLRALLVQERKALRVRTDQHNVSCHRVEQGSNAEAECRRSLSALKSQLAAHVRDSKLYNQGHEKAQQTVVGRKPAPHTDTSVVDARNVPSGLPKGVENAINGAYANAPPGVSERVRKGFQAVMDRDWPVAKAWFQDALNRDPGNANLKRLVALVDRLPAGNNPATAPRPRSAPARYTLTSLNANASRMNTEQVLKALEEIMEENLEKTLPK